MLGLPGTPNPNPNLDPYPKLTAHKGRAYATVGAEAAGNPRLTKSKVTLGPIANPNPYPNPNPNPHPNANPNRKPNPKPNPNPNPNQAERLQCHGASPLLPLCPRRLRRTPAPAAAAPAAAIAAATALATALALALALAAVERGRSRAFRAYGRPGCRSAA